MNSMTTKPRRKTITQMTYAIERRVTVREISRSHAGWGMHLVLGDDPAQPDKATVYRHWPTLEECVWQEYRYWVLQKDIPSYPTR